MSNLDIIITFLVRRRFWARAHIETPHGSNATLSRGHRGDQDVTAFTSSTTKGWAGRLKC